MSDLAVLVSKKISNISEYVLKATNTISGAIQEIDEFDIELYTSGTRQSAKVVGESASLTWSLTGVGGTGSSCGNGCATGARRQNVVVVCWHSHIQEVVVAF